ncbi:MAG: LysM peptidoglycan-binding domain-containing protein [Saccharofermentanales bacterium]|jgi:LysM repeat protein
MAKLPRADRTRIAATVTARYYPSSGATDGFYLDGRLSGRREHRAADITLDREARGFFYSVYAHLGGSGSGDAEQNKIRQSFEKIYNDVHHSSRNIDDEISELADCAMSVTGRISLQHDGVRQPYFAGIIVKNAELAAVTMGSGCAYLYRGDVLYPLTADDYPIEAIDGNGKPVQGIDVYCAGVTGPIRYSNIAQLQLDDCLIACNKEVMDALGQQDVLRLLYEAEDQADAAGLIITAAAAKLPGVPMQFMIGFVESISTADRTGRFGTGRFLTDKGSSGPLGGILTGRSVDRAATESPISETQYQTPPVLDDDNGEVEFVPPTVDRSYLEPPGPMDPLSLDDSEEAFLDYDDDFERRGRGRRVAFYLVIAAVCIACIFAIYSMLKGSDRPTPPVQSSTSTTTESTAPTDPKPSPGESTEPTEPTTDVSSTTTTAPPAGGQTYTVKAGDALWSICNKFYGTASDELVQLIRDANNITGDTIKAGDVLKIPPKP